MFSVCLGGKYQLIPISDYSIFAHVKSFDCYDVVLHQNIVLKLIAAAKLLHLLYF